MYFLCCPICGKALIKEEKRFYCSQSHSFDIAKEGYVNLIVGSKSGNLMGDSREMAKNRKSFLSKDYYKCLSDKLIEIISEFTDVNTVLDICCGEGYYTEKIAGAFPKTDVFGFDISREMVRLAAKRRCNAEFFVANMSRIPCADNSVDTAIHLFAPFHDKEFYRVLKKGGHLISVEPGKNHLFGLKSVIYDSPYRNSEPASESELFTFVRRINLSDNIIIDNNDDIMALFQMTPYYYRTSEHDRRKLEHLTSLETELDFNINVYVKD